MLLLFLASGVHTPVPAGKAAPKALTACLAISRAEVQFALGRPVVRSQEEISGADSACDYTAGRTQVTLTLQRLKQAVDIQAEMAALQRAIEGSSARLAPKWGNCAFFLDIPGAGTQLHIIRGHNYLLVSVLGLGDPVSTSYVVEKIAQIASARL